MIFYLPYSTIKDTKIEGKVTFLTLNQAEVYFNDQNGEVFKQKFTVSELKQIGNKVAFCVLDKPPYTLSIVDSNVVKSNQFVVVVFDVKSKAIDFRECDVYLTDDIDIKFDIQGLSVQEWNIYGKTHKIFFIDDNTYEWVFPYVSNVVSIKLTSQFYIVDPTTNLTHKVIIKTTSVPINLKFKICTDIFGYGDTQEELKFASYTVGCISPSGNSSILTTDSDKVYTILSVEKGVYRIFPIDNANHRIESLISEDYSYKQTNGNIYFARYEGLLPVEIYVI